MRFYPGDADHQPIRYFGRVPVFATTIIVALLAIGMFVSTMIATAGGPIGLFTFSTSDFYLHGRVWQIFTAMFVNAPQFFFLFTLFFFYWCGIEIEQYFGRRAFLLLFGLQLAAAPLVLGQFRKLLCEGCFSWERQHRREFMVLSRLEQRLRLSNSPL